MFTKKIRHLLFSVFIFSATLSAFALGSAKLAYADPVLCPDGQTVDIQNVRDPAVACVGHMTVPGGGNYTGTPVDADGQKIYRRLEDGINLLSAFVGIAVVGSIVLGAIQYTTAGADPQKVNAAKNRIFNALIALFAFIFIFAFLQWLVPGGLF